ncbi:hypothetical protein ACYSUO_32460 [Streptomyces sp. UC4497]
MTTSVPALAAHDTTRLSTPDTESITQDLVETTNRQVFPVAVDLTIPQWVPAHTDLRWGNALAVPALAERVRRERRPDLESRSGRLMALFFCAKVTGPHAHEADPRLEPARKHAAQLIGELQST